MAEAQDVDTLKRRGRRRLVGAVALVLAAVIILPMVFDPEPRKETPPVSVRIPGEDESKFAPKPVAKPEPRKVEEEKKIEEKKVEEKKVQEKKVEDRKGAGYVVQVGAFANPDGVVAKLKGANVPYFTEAAQGNLTRVRAGPFATREAADKALDTLRRLGLTPGAVTTRAG